MFTNLFTYLFKVLALFIFLILFESCGGVQPLREAFRKQTAYEKYAQSLKNAKLENTALGKDWLEAGRQSLQDSLVITLPFKETGYFAADKPFAVSFRLDARRGERLVIETDIKSTQPVRVFLDVFELDNNFTKEPKHVASADTNSISLIYEVEEDRIHLIRLQPELLRSGNYTINIIREPTLTFPVSGKDSRQIGSFWGVPRDAGARRHEGVDIFAKKGTPAIAAVNGHISAANENRLGGKVVWLVDENRQQTLYYAHLDSQLVHAGQKVSIGDTIGLIGNTGNARTTAPHLHFGIYRFGRGAFDPYPALRTASESPLPVVADMKRLATWARVAVKKGILRLSPDSKSPVIAKLAKYAPVYITAGTKSWYKVKLPANETGYITNQSIENIENPVRTQRIQAESFLLETPDENAPFLSRLEAGVSVPVLADTGSFLYIKTPEGLTGWLSK